MQGGEKPFLLTGSEASEIIASFDWSATPLGPVSSWPASMKSTLGLILRSPVPIVTLWGEDGIMIYNDAYSVFAGGRHPELFGSKVREGWPEVADFNDNVMKVGLAGGTLAYRDQELTLHRNGQPEQVWMNLDYSPIPDETGKPVGVIAIVVETTRRVEAEQQLERGFETLRRMFEQAPGFIAILAGPEHTFVMVNNAYMQLVGYRDALGKPMRDALPEMVDQGFLSLLDRVRETEEPYIGRNIRVMLKREPGLPAVERYLDFVFHPVTAARSDTRGIFVQGHDVTERRLAEIALKESEERFRLVAESSPVMLWMGDETGKCIYLNDAQRKFWNVKMEDIPDFDWSRTVHPDDREALHAPFSAAMEAHTAFSVEVRFRRADGEYRAVRTNAQPRFGPQGQFAGMIGVNVDVTEMRRAEEALQAANQNLEQRVAREVAERSRAEEALRQAQKMEAIGKLTGGVAHDFNNLLQVVSGNLQLLSKDIAGNERAERRVANALAGVDRGAKLASQLLAFGRRQPLEPKVINIGRLVAGMGDMLRRTIGEGVEVETVVSGGLWNTFVDPAQLENALLNLAINARDAMNDSGRMTIEAGNAYLDDAYVLDHPEITRGQYVVLAVTDTGSGIPADVLPHVFEPFFSTKPQGKGTGLGLSMVYGFVKQSGGHIKVYSEVEHGTTVKLYLPRAMENEDVMALPGAGPPTGGTETILVAEDDDAVRATVVEMLNDLGYRVLTARDAASALTVLESGVPVDLLFTDVVMPGPLKSTDLARKARERLPGIGVLFTSGYTENSIVHGGRLDTGVELLSKPYTREALARKVRHVLTLAGQRNAPDGGTTTRESAPEGTLTVLLCEDDVLIRMNTAEMLESEGMIVIETGTAQEALEAMKSGTTHILIADVGLPDMSGVDLAVKLRESFPTLPVIFATGHNDVPGADAMPFCAVVPKPYDIAQIKRQIEALVASGRLHGRNG
ncbi:PAS domain S-box protein [Parvibaculum sp.]|uniref:hybrid sensor histidine kinase/response regulator n=1 Tax=Parvibaculum sp. TaxID=2024848 RepID=UPI002730F55F|nr:PAS domain S-box protein [Parvibaculum sp.]MDP1627769.1 PAS domain S-box protein [Parvibaculum sp.]MDP2150767.1 PAS domain S-box protein [Parvibaculum sp.]MDP3328839.1 PAS domain S-box protein [Parvibaculum sp.]